MERINHDPYKADNLKQSSDEDAFADYLISIIDPGTPEEQAFYNESARRITNYGELLREKLPIGPSGEIGRIRISEVKGELNGEKVVYERTNDPRFDLTLETRAMNGEDLTPEERQVLKVRRERVQETEGRLRKDLRSSRPPRAWRATW